MTNNSNESGETTTKSTANLDLDQSISSLDESFLNSSQFKDVKEFDINSSNNWKHSTSGSDLLRELDELGLGDLDGTEDLYTKNLVTNDIKGDGENLPITEDITDMIADIESLIDETNTDQKEK